MTTAAGRRVLLAWEMGGHLGHFSRLGAIARIVEDGGGTPLWAVPAPAMGSQWLAAVPRDRIRPAPPPAQPLGRVAVLSYASILLNVGFSNAAGLAEAVGRWRALLSEMRPDLVVLDSAPVAQLATLFDGWPALLVSNGFDSPPSHFPTFGIGMRGPFAEDLNARHRRQLAATLDLAGNTATGTAGPSPERYLSYPRRYVDGIPETDPYGERHDHPPAYVGPLTGLDALNGLDAPAWPVDPRASRLNVFAYLRASPLRDCLLQALARLGANTLCVTTGPTTGNPPRTRMVSTPVQLGPAVAQADLVVSEGSFGLMTIARMAGKPQLAVPTEVDKTTLARRLARDGGAVWLAPDREPDGSTIGDAVGTALELQLAPVTADPRVAASLRDDLRGRSIPAAAVDLRRSAGADTPPAPR